MLNLLIKIGINTKYIWSKIISQVYLYIIYKGKSPKAYTAILLKETIIVY
jgi:hypothetical protein